MKNKSGTPLVRRNLKDFVGSPVTAITPDDMSYKGRATLGADEIEGIRFFTRLKNIACVVVQKGLEVDEESVS